MQTKDLQQEITSLHLQILNQENRLDQALTKNVEIKETKKIYHELRVLKERLAEINSASEIQDLP